ncbi:MAG: hypothetical protein JNM20_01960 [Rhizobiales bacterium]|nr:hypothetical protein [Hyphomicrobiales bacterium]
MGNKFGGWIAVAVLLFILFYIYNAYPDLRGLLTFGALFSAMLGGCALCRDSK